MNIQNIWLQPLWEEDELMGHQVAKTLGLGLLDSINILYLLEELEL